MYAQLTLSLILTEPHVPSNSEMPAIRGARRNAETEGRRILREHRHRSAPLRRWGWDVQVTKVKSPTPIRKMTRFAYDFQWFTNFS